MIRFLKVLLLIVFTSHFVLYAGLFAQSEENEPELSHKELHIEPDRTVRLQTNEGTWMSLDIHPSGERIIFDFMGDLYELPVNGGEATRLTRGMAFDSQPRYSPDGGKEAPGRSGFSRKSLRDYRGCIYWINKGCV